MKKNKIWIIIVVFLALVIYGGFYVRDALSPVIVEEKFDYTPRYTDSGELINNILTSLNQEEINLTPTQLEWYAGDYEESGGKYSKETYNGYEFIVNYTVDENKKFSET